MSLCQCSVVLNQSIRLGIQQNHILNDKWDSYDIDWKYLLIQKYP